MLLVAGDGPQADEVAGLASRAIRPLGFRRDVDRLLVAADIFVLPSTREGLSFAVLEAMAQGLALVVSDGPGNPEAVGDSGIVVPAGDVDAWAAALAALAPSASGWVPRRASERARSSASSRCSPAWPRPTTLCSGGDVAGAWTVVASVFAGVQERSGEDAVPTLFSAVSSDV